MLGLAKELPPQGLWAVGMLQGCRWDQDLHVAPSAVFSSFSLRKAVSFLSRVQVLDLCVG